MPAGILSLGPHELLIRTSHCCSLGPAYPLEDTLSIAAPLGSPCSLFPFTDQPQALSLEVQQPGMPSALGKETPTDLVSRACTSDIHTRCLKKDGHHNHEKGLSQASTPYRLAGKSEPSLCLDLASHPRTPERDLSQPHVLLDAEHWY